MNKNLLSAALAAQKAAFRFPSPHLLARRDFATGEGEGGTGTGAGNGDGENRLTEKEWEDRKRAQLAGKSIDQLVEKQIALERDLVKARAKAAPDGAVVLTADEAKEWEVFRGLGKADDVSKRLKTGEEAATKLAGRERGDTLREVAEIAGFKVGPFSRLADQDGLSFEVGAEVEKDGKKSRPVTVKTKDGKSAPLTDYVKTNWADFEPSLTSTGDGKGNGTGGGNATGAGTRTDRRTVPTGGAASNAGSTAQDARAAKKADTRYSI